MAAAALMALACDDSDAGACTNCGLSVTSVATLAVDTGQFVLGELSTAVPFHAGYVAISADRTRLLAFSREGRLSRVVGTSGNGPGEFATLGMLVALQNGGLLATDESRYHVLDSSLKWTNSFAGRGRACQRSVSDTSLFCVSTRPTAHTFSVASLTGAEMEAFGPGNQPEVQGGCPLCAAWVLYDHAPQNDVLFASVFHRMLGTWRSGQSTVTSRPYALPPGLRNALPSSRIREPQGLALGGKVIGGWRDPNGNVVVAVHAPMPKERSNANTQGALRRPGSTTLNEFGTYRTVFAAFDSDDRHVGELPFPGERVMPIGPSLAVRPKYDSAGFVQLEILRILLKASPTRYLPPT